MANEKAPVPILENNEAVEKRSRVQFEAKLLSLLLGLGSLPYLIYICFRGLSIEPTLHTLISVLVAASSILTSALLFYRIRAQNWKSLKTSGKATAIALLVLSVLVTLLVGLSFSLHYVVNNMRPTQYQPSQLAGRQVSRPSDPSDLCVYFCNSKFNVEVAPKAAPSSSSCNPGYNGNGFICYPGKYAFVCGDTTNLLNICTLAYRASTKPSVPAPHYVPTNPTAASPPTVVPAPAPAAAPSTDTTPGYVTEAQSYTAKLDMLNTSSVYLNVVATIVLALQTALVAAISLRPLLTQPMDSTLPMYVPPPPPLYSQIAVVDTVPAAPAYTREVEPAADTPASAPLADSTPIVEEAKDSVDDDSVDTA